MDDDVIERAAALLLAAQRDHEQLRELPRSCRPDTLAEAYAIQARFVAGLGGAPVGYKVAASNPAIQKRFDITAPLSGRLIEGRVFTSPATIDPSALFRIGIETEYAFRMGRDLPPAGAPYGRERVAEAVATLVPAIEIVDWRFANATAIGALLMVTDNAFGAYWVAGAAIADWRDLDIVHAEVVTRIGGTLAATGTGANVLGDPVVSLTWLANDLAVRGEGLRAGDHVTTGSCHVVVTAEPGDTVSADFGALGVAEVSFTA